MNEIVDNVKTDKLLIGAKQSIKALRKEALSKVFVASNCPRPLVEDLNHYASLDGIPVEKLNIACDELGTLCKKPFMVSVVGLKK